MTSSSSTSGSGSGSSQSVPSSIDSAGTLPTQDCIDGNWSEHEESMVDDTIWGRLYPLGKGFNVFDLRKDCSSFGRNTECDVCYTAADFNRNLHFQALSKNHFDVIRESNNDSDSHIIYIKDWSSNGTFLNGELIGKGNKQVLQNNDEIQLARIENRAYVFIDLKSTNKEQEEIPQEVREKYTVSRILGRGACGEVRLAFTKGKECKKYAIKIINKEKFSSADPVHSKDKILQEAEILKRLNHPCIVKIEDVVDTSKMLFIVLELIEGGELFDRVSKGRLTEDETKLLFYQMLIAVQYLHQNGFIHRDLKPENVLLCSTEKETLIKITDFGVSKFIGEKSYVETLCGTPSYIAPEVIRDEPRRYNKECDCWSLGVILFVCLGGYPPFADHPKFPIAQQILKGLCKFPDSKWRDVSDEAKDLIQRLLTVDFNQRITIEEAIKHPWLQNEAIIAKAKKLISERKWLDDQHSLFVKPSDSTIATSKRREATEHQPATATATKKQKLDE